MWPRWSCLGAGRKVVHRDFSKAPGAVGSGHEPAVLAQLGQQNAVESAGAVQTPLDVVQVRVAGQFKAMEDLRAMPIRAGANQLRLGDIAEIKRDYVDPPTVKVRFQGQEVIALGVSMTKGGDIIALGKALGNATQRIEKTLPIGVGLWGRSGSAQGRWLPRLMSLSACPDRGGGDCAGSELHQSGPAQTPGQPAPVEALDAGRPARAWWWASPFRWCWP